MTKGTYKWIQLGDRGDFVLRSDDHENLYICPVCYAKGKMEIPLQLTGAKAEEDGYKQYMCSNSDCGATSSTHPGVSVYRDFYSG